MSNSPHRDRGYPERLTSIVAAGVAKPGPWCCGPTATSCWIIPGAVLWSEQPRGAALTALIDSNVTHFLSACSDLIDDPLSQPAVGFTYTHVDVSQPLISSGSIKGISACALAIKTALSSIMRTPSDVLCIYCESGAVASGMLSCAVLAFVYGISGLKASTLIWQLYAAGRECGPRDYHFSPSQKALIRDVSADTQPWRGNSPESSPMPLDASHLSGSLMCETEGCGTPSPTKRSGARFANTQGSGGGFQTLRLFDGGSTETTPSQRRARSSTDAATASNVPSPTQTPHQPIATPSSATRKQASTSASDVGLTGAQEDGQLREPTNMFHDLKTSLVLSLRRESLAHAWGLLHRGTVVQYVLPRSPADQAGVVPGDIILAVENGAFDSNEFFDWLTREAVVVTISVKRCVAGEERTSAPTISIPRLSIPPSLTLHPHLDDLIPAMLDARLEQSIIQGPIPQSHWVIRDRLLCGPLPDPSKKSAFAALQRQSFDIMVSLLESEFSPQAFFQEPTQFVQFPLEQRAPLPASTFAAVIALVRDIIRWTTSEGKRVYLHCREGHGRVTMIAACTLAILYNLPPMRAVNYAEALHSCRADTGPHPSQTGEQRLSVVALLHTLAS